MTTKTERTPFTLDQVLDAAREVVDGRGSDYVYPGAGSACFYATSDEKPSCLVGHVIFKLDPEAFATIATAEREGCESKAAQDLIYDNWLPDNFWTDDAIAAMQYAQVAQDEGATWGDALAAAEDLGADAD